MKRLLTLMFVLAGIPAMAQNTLSGKIADKNTGAPEPGAVAQVIDGETSAAYGVADSLGAFSIRMKLPEGTYVLEVKNMGRKTVRQEFKWEGHSLDLGTIEVEDDAQTLKSATVTTQRTLVKMDVDKTTYDVAGDTDAKASNVLDMLRKVPMVTVDGQDNITVNGSGSFKVYVDGKPNQMLSSNPSKMFKAMPAAAVQNIEVITNPGARYDAEGAGAVINLVTRSADGSRASVVPDGANGQVSLGGNTRGGLDAGLVLNAKKGKFTFGSNVFVGREKNRDIEVDYIQKNGTMEQKQHFELDQTPPWLFGDLNASLELDSLNLISASVGLQNWSSDQISKGTSEAWLAGVKSYEYGMQSDSKYSMYGINGSIDWQRSFRGHPDRNFILSYRFESEPQYSKDETTYTAVLGTTPLDSKKDNHDDSMEHTFQADYTTGIGKGQELNAGAKYIFRNNKADDHFYDLVAGNYVEADGSGNYNHYNHIAAAYGEWSGNFGKFGVKTGLRYERTYQKVVFVDGKSFESNFDNLVPNMSLQFNAGPTSNLGLTYNMQIQRPGISYLNPFVDRSNPKMISKGDSSIKPTTIHRVALKYNFYSPKLMVSASAGWDHSGDGISQYSYFQADTMVTTYGNILHNDAVRGSAFVNWNIGSKTRIYTNLSGNWNTFSSSRLDQSNSGWGFSGMLGFQQTLPWDLRFSANLFGNSRRYNLQGYSGSFSGIATGLSKSFLEDKLTLSIQAFSPLEGARAHFRNYTAGNGFSSENNVSVPISRVGFELSWSFGKSHFQVKKARKTISNDDVVGASTRQGQVDTSSMQQK